MSSLVAALAFVLAMAFAAPSAFADFQYLSTGDAANVVVGSGSLASTTISDGGTDDHALGGAPDGITVTFTAGAGGATLRLRLNFDSAASNPGLILYGLTDSGSGVTITQVAWGTGAFSGSFPSSTTIVTTAVPDASSTFSLRTPFDSYSPAFTAGTNQVAFVFFTLPANATLTLDAVSNPEPGTFALFALGAAVFGGLRLRRRKAVRRSGAAA
ncbi:MAG: PEP-CTERM sorting domain-containing protein [Planctomycetes bacterium]|nr:PEP-CTERM sorting domain-containing protein [Planctomycetota bacterium]